MCSNKHLNVNASRPLGIYWTVRYLLDLYVPLGLLGISWTFRYLLEL